MLGMIAALLLLITLILLGLEAPALLEIFGALRVGQDENEREEI